MIRKKARSGKNIGATKNICEQYKEIEKIKIDIISILISLFIVIPPYEGFFRNLKYIKIILTKKIYKEIIIYFFYEKEIQKFL